MPRAHSIVSIILNKVMDIIPGPLWLLLFHSYSNMFVEVKWQDHISEPVQVKRGTKQESLTSPFCFNIFYQDLIEKLQVSNCGVKLNNKNYNCYSYADDILLSSLTVTGQQQLLDIANEYITDHGLLFNPDKTVCMIYGNNPFTEQPRWHMNNTSLKQENSMKYLGTTFGDSGGKSHINNRIKAATRASFGLLSAGVERPNVIPSVAIDIYQTVSVVCFSLDVTLVILIK